MKRVIESIKILEYVAKPLGKKRFVTQRFVNFRSKLSFNKNWVYKIFFKFVRPAMPFCIGGFLF